jgi:uncharacterized membrane protein
MSENQRPRAAPFDIAAAVIGALQLALAGYIARYGPQGRLPMHFSIDGAVNRWGSRYEVVAVLVFLAMLTLGLDLAFAMTLRRTRPTAGEARSLAVGRGLSLFILASVTVLMGALGLGKLTPDVDQIANMRLVLGAIWLVFAVTGGLIGKLGPNRFAGVRVYWTRHSRLAWDKANRLLGRIYFLGGLAGLACLPFLGARQNFTLLMAVTLGGGAIAIVESWRVWRTDPERT